MNNFKKPKSKVKTIIKRPVFNVIPYNMHWMDKMMTKVFPDSNLMTNVSTQTAENIDIEIVENELINVKVEIEPENPYKSTSNLQSSPKINQMRIRHKKSKSKKMSQTKDYLNREDDIAHSNEKLSKSIYDHRGNSGFSSNLAKISSNHKNHIKKRVHSKRNNNKLQGSMDKSLVY